MLIDLGEAPRPEVVERAVARPPVPYRAVLAALAAVLVAMLAGGAHRVPQQAPAILPASLGDASYLARDLMFVVGTARQTSRSDVQVRVISTYRLPDARQLSRTTITVSGAVVGVTQTGGTVLAEYQDSKAVLAVVAQAAGADRALWRRTARLMAASAADGLALLSDDSVVQAVDLTSGVVRWSVPRPADGLVMAAGYVPAPGAVAGVGSVVGALIGYPRWLVVVTDSGRLETLDARTGSPLATATLPALPGRANGMIWPVSDMIMVDTGAGFDGYRLPGLTRLWHTTADLSQAWMQAECAGLLCTFRQQRGITALDAATGRQVWTSDHWQDVQTAGHHLLATVGEDEAAQPKLRVLDPATGRETGNFGDWTALGPPAPDGHVYAKLDARGQYKFWYGVLDPDTMRVRILGSGDRVSGGCEASGGALVCRLVDASIAVWRLG
jgi:hypothetical protein